MDADERCYREPARSTERAGLATKGSLAIGDRMIIA